MDGAAVVLRAWQPAFQRHVAVHLHAGQPFEDLEALARKVAPLAAHPNVVTMHDMGVTAKGVPYCVTEVLDTAPSPRRSSGTARWTGTTPCR